MDALKLISQGSMKNEFPSFNIGDTVRVSVNIKEGERERIQMFEGTVIARKGSGVAETFTVKFVAASFTICATGWVRLLKLKRNFIKKILRGKLSPFLF